MKKCTWLALFFSGVLMGCEEEVFLKIPQSERKPIVYCIYTTDSLVTLTLMHDSSDPYTNNAKVKLYASNSFAEELLSRGEGRYSASSTRIQLATSYSLEINTADYSTITATDTSPNRVPIISATHRDSTGLDHFNSTLADFTITFKDLPQQENYYEVFISQTIDTSQLILIDTTLSDLYIEGENLRETQKKEMSFKLLSLLSKDPSIQAEGFTDYAGAFQDQNFLFFNDRLFDGETKTLKIQYYPYYNEQLNGTLYYYAPERNFEIHLRSISKNYYLYRKSQKQYVDLNNQNTIWRNAGDYVDLYTNMDNGYGVFAGYSTSIYNLNVIQSID